MAYKTIQETFWTDPDIMGLSYKGKLLILYLITSPHCHYSGMYYLPEAFIHIETSLPVKEVKVGLQDLIKKGFIQYDEHRSVVWIIKMARYQIQGGASNAKMMAGVMSHFETLHKTPLINEFSKYYAEFDIPLRSPLEAPSKPLVNPFGNKEQGTVTVIRNSNSNKEQETGNKEKEELVGQVVLYLNTVLQTNYKPSGKEIRRLVTGKAERFTLDDFKTVIDKKAAEWKNDPKMHIYLRPETLFGSKFESYLNQRAGPAPLPYSDTTAHNIEVMNRWLENSEGGESGEQG